MFVKIGESKYINTDLVVFAYRTESGLEITMQGNRVLMLSDEEADACVELFNLLHNQTLAPLLSQVT